jgi:hypothetical protein
MGYQHEFWPFGTGLPHVAYPDGTLAFRTSFFTLDYQNSHKRACGGFVGAAQSRHHWCHTAVRKD